MLTVNYYFSNAGAVGISGPFTQSYQYIPPNYLVPALYAYESIAAELRCDIFP